MFTKTLGVDIRFLLNYNNNNNDNNKLNDFNNN